MDFVNFNINIPISFKLTYTVTSCTCSTISGAGFVPTGTITGVNVFVASSFTHSYYEKGYTYFASKTSLQTILLLELNFN